MSAFSIVYSLRRRCPSPERLGGEPIERPSQVRLHCGVCAERYDVGSVAVGSAPLGGDDSRNASLQSSPGAYREMVAPRDGAAGPAPHRTDAPPVGGRVLNEPTSNAETSWKLESEPEGMYHRGSAESWRAELSSRDLRVVEHIVSPLMDELGSEHAGGGRGGASLRWLAHKRFKVLARKTEPLWDPIVSRLT